MAKHEGAFTMVPNWILDNTSLSVYDRAILIHIARQTIGYGKKSDGISISQFVKATGIGRTKVIQAITELEEKQYIKVKRQTLPSGGQSFNKYSLHPRSPHGLPCSQDEQPPVRHTNTQNKIEQNMRERILFDEDNIFHTLTEHEQEREVNAYADYVSMDAKHPEAYKVKIMKQIRREHHETLKAFQEWYLKKTCAALTAQYGGKSSGRYEIEIIYPYTDTKGYADGDAYEKEHLFYVQFKGAGEDKVQVLGADSYQALKALLDNLIGKGTP